MPKIPNIKREEVNFETVKFFVCPCSSCGRKQEIFADEIHKPHFCKKCGEELDFNRCNFEIPENRNHEEKS